MIKKPDVLSDERIEQIRNNYSFSGMSGILYAKTISQAQRDADVKHCEPLIKEMYEALKKISVILANPLTTRNEPTPELRVARARDEAWIISREAVAKVESK